MGIGNADGSPTSAGPQPRLLLWLDGSSASPYVNNAPVDIWNDKSGNGHHFLPLLPSGTYRPSLRTGGTFSGPKGTFTGAPETPCVRFLDRDDHLFCSDFELPEDGYSIYFVIITDDDNYGLFSYSTPTSEREMLIYNDNGIRQQMDNTLERGSAIGDLSNNQWSYGGITYSNDDADNWEYTRTATHETGFNTFDGISISTSGTAMIGQIQNALEDYPNIDNFEGSIAEIIIYEGRLPRPATRLLRTYFWVKYGLNGSPGGWDKFHGNMDVAAGNQWGGKYYAPIGIGNDVVNPNSGSINEARSEGLVLRVNQGEWTQTRSYLCAAPVGNSILGLPTNQISTLNLGSTPSVIKRWTRLWEIAGNSEGNGQEFQVAFDFGEGIDGDIPQNPENYVLLYRTSPTSGNFSILPVPNGNKFVLDDELVFRVPKSDLITPGRFYTIGTTDEASSLTGDIKRTWYAYKSGNWSDTLTWTLDGSASPSYVNPDGDIPNIFDDIFIGSGRTVTVDMTLPAHGDLKVFGTLNLASANQPSFLTIGGSGLIRCSAGNFPTGNSDAFADPVFGGTLEFYGGGGFTQTTNLTVNKLKINLSTTAATMTLAANLTTNGLFEVNRGTFIVNNSANIPRTIISNERVLVESPGIVKVANAPPLTTHRWYFYNDLINNGGEVRFTNRTAADENFTDAYNKVETNDIIIAHFSSGSNNQELRANGLSYFSKVVIDKGVDITYILSISSINSSYFKLLGPCRTNMSEADFSPEIPFPGNVGNPNSFALINGTAEIRENIFIPLLINVGNYNINKTAQLWINGGEATKGRLGGTGNSAALVNYGLIKVTSGVLNTFCQSGITIRGNGVVQVDGGVINANQIRTSLLGPTNIGGLIINDGVVNIDGNRPEGSLDSYYTLSLTYPGNLFRMTGGTLNVTGPTNTGLIFINSDPQNTSVSGGTVHLDVSDTQDRYNISSRAAFWDLTLTRSNTSTPRNFKVVDGSSGPDTNMAYIPRQDLIIKNMLTLTGPNGPKLQMGTAGNPADLYLSGNLSIGSGCVYIHNQNTTHFVGTSNSFLTFGGSTADPAFPFYNVEVKKDLDTRFISIQQAGPQPSMDILGSLYLEKGYFVNKNRHVDVRGNVINRTQFGDETSPGFLRMSGNSGRQEIISEGGVFHWLRIDNLDGVELKNDGVTLKTRLTLDNGSFFIGDNKLRMETTNSLPIQFANSVSKFIVCSGNASAGGLEILNHADGQSLNYPIGVSTGLGLKWTPVDIYINGGWADDGFIRVTPVDTLLSTADLSGTADYLNFYWRVSSTDYGTKPSVSHRFRYFEDDIRGTEANFEPGRVLSDMPFTRNIDNAPVSSHINTGSNLIYYNGSDQAQATTVGLGTPLVDANYTAGNADRFPPGSSPDIFFSRSAALGAAWATPGNWNKLSECTGCTDIYDYHSTSSPASATDFPETGDIAVIGFDVSDPLYRPHVYKAPAGGIAAAQIIFTPLQDASGVRQPRFNGSVVADLGILRPTLEIANTSDIIKVAQISGEGALMLKGNVDVGVSDIGGFLAEDSSVVVINNNNVSTPIDMNFLPAVVPNLFLARTVPVITSDIRIRGNLEVAGQSRLTLSETVQGNIEVNGDLILDKYQSATGAPRVLFNNRGSLKTIQVHGDVKLLGTTAYIGIDILSGPPVAPVPWTPSEIDAFIWLDATNGVTASGGSVSAWADQASGTYIASQSDPGKRPTYQIGMNGLNTIRFDGVDDFLAIPHANELNILANQDFEIFSVVQFNDPVGATPDDFSIIFGKGVINSRDFLLYLALNRYRVYIDGNQMGIIAPSDQTTAPNLGWVRRQGNSGELYNTVGGSASKGNVANATMTGNTHNVTIGAAEDGTQRFMDGDIAEIILIKRSLTNDERQLVEGYLAHKWGMEDELPDGHPFKNEIPLIGGNDNTAQLIVDGDIIQDLSSSATTNNGLKLYETVTDTSFVNLIVTNSGANEFVNLGGPAPRLWKLRVDKGINTTSSFTFNADVNIEGPANESEKPVNLQNGLLKFNHPNIDITLSSGGGDFIIPLNAGLELNNGNLQITGNETGLLLSGLLKLTGGTLTLGDTEGLNNYIEYGGGSSPKINVSGGILTVGSQIRRNVSSIGGALDFTQSGGQVIIGRYSAPATSRGMLEVVNPGSNFEHTGGILTFVRGVNLGTTPSLLLAPATHNVGETSEIIIGNADSPSGAAIQNFGIQSNIPLSNLTISSTNSPVVHLITNNLELNGDLTIQAGATLNCDDRNLILNQDVANDGFLSASSGLVKLNHPVSGNVSGAGVFDLYDLERSGGSSGITQVQTNLLVKNNFTNDGGEMDFEGNTLTVEGNVTTDGFLKFDATSDGLIFSGAAQQILTRTGSGVSEIDVMTIYNNLGVTIPAGFFEFVINKNLRLEKGVFALTGNLLEMASGSVFTAVNPFSETNMIVTGGAFANFGVKIHVPANTTDDIFVPLGIDRYMPINLDFSVGSSGSTASSYLLRLNLPENGVVIQDIEDPGPQINDLNNVLGMFFSVDGTDIGNGLNVDLKFRYDQQYVQITSPFTESDYIASRVFADNTTIGKYGTTAVDEANKIITFNIQGDFAGDPFAVDGDYFAGVDVAIPSTILVYKTNRPGFVNDGADPPIGGGGTILMYTNELDVPITVPGGSAPAGALVIVQTGHLLIFNVDGVNFYRTIIEPGATVEINRTSLHRLGKVTGSGTIRLRGSGTLPAGDYTDFFGCTGGRLQYRADAGDDFEVLSNMPPIREVNLLGIGNMTIADNAVNICDDFIVSQPTVKTANSALLTVGGNLEVLAGTLDFRQGNSLIQGNLISSGSTSSGGYIQSGNAGKATVEGDLIIGGRGMSLGSVFRETHVKGNVVKNSNPSTGSVKDGTGGAKLLLNGILPQTITGDFTGTSKIPFIELDNSNGLTLNGSVDVSDTLKLTDGNIFTSAVNMLRLTEDGTDVDPIGGRPNSFVNGPLQWALSNTTAERRFPVGKNEYYRPLSISNRSTARTWEVEYSDTIARVVPTIDPQMLPNPSNIPAIETVSKQEFWRVETDASPALANIRLSWGDNSVVSTNTSEQSNLLVLAYNDVTDVWDSYGGQGFTYDAPTNRGSVNSVDPISFSERYFTLGSSDGLVNPLPVTWLYFDGENKEKDNILHWATASEQNNDFFELERSLDASNWNAIAQVTAAGQSYTEQTYSYTDRNAPYGRVYYRLKQVDFDGAMEYAPNIVSIERGFARESETFDFLLFPNPTQLGTVRFRMSTTADALANVSISDLSGKLLAQSYVQIDGQGTSAPVDCNFEPGIYLVTVIVKDKMRSKPLVISK